MLPCQVKQTPDCDPEGRVVQKLEELDPCIMVTIYNHIVIIIKEF